MQFYRRVTAQLQQPVLHYAFPCLSLCFALQAPGNQCSWEHLAGLCSTFMSWLSQYFLSIHRAPFF